MLSHFRIGHMDAAESLIKRFHYSRRVPGNVQLIGTWHQAGGLFGDYGEAIAACLFSIPPTRWTEDVLELSRLVRHEDACPPLTALIAACCSELRRRGADLVVSFADATHDHHGGIYQAASWNYDGKRDAACDGVLMDGVFIPGRSCNSRWGTRSPDKLREMCPGHTVEAHYDEGKFLYWRALTKAGRRKAEKLELVSNPYPKPSNAHKFA